MPPSVLLLCRPFIPFQHLDSMFQTSRALASCLSRRRLLNAMPLSNMRAPCNDDGAMNTLGQPLWLCPLRGNNRSTPPTSLIPLLIPFCAANKVDPERCCSCSPCATVCAAIMTAVLPLAAMPSLAFVVLPCRPLLSSSPLCHPPPCRPLPLSSCRAAPCCVAQCCHRTTLH
jgi:hypothetical protein